VHQRLICVTRKWSSEALKGEKLHSIARLGGRKKISAELEAQNILVSSIFGIIFGIVCGLWASVYDHLWLENASKEFLFNLWVLYSVAIMGIVYMLWTFAKRLGRPRAHNGYDRLVNVKLTEDGKNWIQDNYPQGIVWELNLDKPFTLHSVSDEFVELSNLGVSYRIPHEVNGKPTVKKAHRNAGQ